MKQDRDSAAAAKIAADLAMQTATKAAELAAVAAQTATTLAVKTAETTSIISNDIGWMKQSLTGIETTLSEMQKSFVTSAQHLEVTTELSDHEDRVRKLEKNIQLWAGGLAILAFGFPLLLKFMGKL